MEIALTDDIGCGPEYLHSVHVLADLRERERKTGERWKRDERDAISNMEHEREQNERERVSKCAKESEREREKK